MPALPTRSIHPVSHQSHPGRHQLRLRSRAQNAHSHAPGRRTCLLPRQPLHHHPPPLPCHLHSPRPTPTTDQATSENTQQGETAFVRMSPALILAKATLHYTISPPSTTSECPVTNEAPSEQSQMTASAMSCGWPSRCRGISDMMRAVVSGSLPTRSSYIEV
jgi:hypothetical protein